MAGLIRATPLARRHTTCRAEDEPAGQPCGFRKSASIYLIVSAPALQACPSWGAVPPLQPMAPITLPFASRGSPPSTAMAPRVRIGRAGGEPETASAKTLVGRRNSAAALALRIATSLEPN